MHITYIIPCRLKYSITISWPFNAPYQCSSTLSTALALPDIVLYTALALFFLTQAMYSMCPLHSVILLYMYIVQYMTAAYLAGVHFLQCII